MGVDIAPSLIEFAVRQFRDEGLSGTFIVGDVRGISYHTEFHACAILSGTFGFFGDLEDRNLLSSVCRAPKVGGRAFVMLLSAQEARARSRSCSETQDGGELTEAWCDAETSTYRSKVVMIRKDGTLLRPKTEPGYHANNTIWCYTIPEMRTMLAQAVLPYIVSYSPHDLSTPPQYRLPRRQFVT